MFMQRPRFHKVSQHLLRGSSPFTRVRPGASAVASGLLLLASSLLSPAYAVEGFDMVAATHLVEVSQGSGFSSLLADFRRGSFESATGERVAFTSWYSPAWTDTRVGFLTQISPSFGLLWGVSSGERGEKYVIDPSARLGFLLQRPLTKHTNFSVAATTMLGGRLQEKTCTADYGEIGGVQEVNCRLAASELAPAETLKYLVNQPPPAQHQITLRLHVLF
jgi:hypothetical protein